MTFLTAYKKVDNLIKDAYASDSGVSTYIEEIERTSYQNWYGVRWEDTYKKLKHYRYIRNQIVHDDNASEESLCSFEDVQWLEKFYNDLLIGDDPLARRGHIVRQNSSVHKNTPRQKPVYTNNKQIPTHSKKSLFKRVSDFFKKLFH